MSETAELTVESVEALEALPNESIVRSAVITFNGTDGVDIWARRHGSWFCITAITIEGVVHRGSAAEIALPAVALHVPEALQ